MKDKKISELERQIANLKKMVFGAKADRNPNKDQLKKDDGPSDQSAPGHSPNSTTPNSGKELHGHRQTPKRSAPRNRSGRGKREFPKHLERCEIYMGTPDKKCPCGCGGSILGYDINETLELVPARRYVAVRKYPKYRCRAADKVMGTPFIPRIFPQTTMSNGVLAHVIFMRFGAYLPWYRQEGLLKASGIDLNRSTLMSWSNRTATQALLPLYELLMHELLRNSVRLFMDETTIPMLTPGKGKTSTSYLFALHRYDRSFGGNLPPIVLYCPSKTRAKYKIHELLSGVTAIVQTDAYAGYGQLGRKGTEVEGIISPKCWAHTRRHFTDEFKRNKTDDARIVIEFIAELYAEETKIRGKPPLVRKAHRQKYSAPILARLKAFLDDCSGRHLTKGGMAKAINYAQQLWPDLVLFVDDGRIDLDTNPVERMFKPSILLRKNALFMGSDEGAEAWGILSSIVETCKLNGVNVEPYLNWVLDQIAAKLPRSEYDKLLPWNAPSKFMIGRQNTAQGATG
ncbi:IS66 family transposase [Ruegeria pomeroyi]|nr:IS66 family transposase [Ruegeria pomeroyi]